MKQSGFSLVELSIVLVILGLLTGAVLTGQNLIRAAELRSVITEYQAFQTAAMTFRDKYFALPGDMTNATDFWGAMTNCGVASPSGSGTQTCNGTGEGQISASSAASRTGEAFAFWQHLSNAGLIEGQYTGIAGSGSTLHTILRTNVPASKLNNGGWSVLWENPKTSASANAFVGTYNNTFFFGAQVGSDVTWHPLLSTEEAWNIDTKLDDGKPGLGKIRSLKNTSPIAPGCATTNDVATAEYALSTTGALCSFMLPQPY